MGAQGGILYHQGVSVKGIPYHLFSFFCVEGLSALIKNSVRDGNMEGIALCRGGPKLSHLFFAGDSLIFCKASISKCSSLQRVLHVYEQASRQQLNRAKTALFFNKNTLRSKKRFKKKKNDLVPKS